MRLQSGLVMLVAALAWVAVPGAAGAHGGTVRVDNNFGPYHIIAATGPGTKAGDLVLTVVLSTPDAGDAAITPVLGATVSATFTLTGTAVAPVTYPIPTEPTLGEFGYYENIVTIPADGDWLVTVAVSGQAGSSQASFPVAMRRPPPELQAPWVQWALLGLPILIALGTLVYVWRGRRPPTEAASEAAPPAPPTPRPAAGPASNGRPRSKKRTS